MCKSVTKLLQKRKKRRSNDVMGDNSLILYLIFVMVIDFICLWKEERTYKKLYKRLEEIAYTKLTENTEKE